MVRLMLGRSHADEFASAVDATADGGSTTQTASNRARGRAAETHSFLVLVEQLRAVESPGMRAEFAAGLRARLLDVAPVELSAAARASHRDEEGAVDATGPSTGRQSAWRSPTSRTRRRLVSVIATSSVVVGSTAGVAMASQSALPGQTLYPVKRSLERLEVTLLRSPFSKGEELLEQAGTRLNEIGALARDGVGDVTVPPLVTVTLDLFTTQSHDGASSLMTAYREDGSTESIALLRSFAEESAAELSTISANLPPSLNDEVTDAALWLTWIDDEALSLCPDCSNLGSLQLSDTFISAPGLPLPPETLPEPEDPGNPGTQPAATNDPTLRPSTEPTTTLEPPVSLTPTIPTVTLPTESVGALPTISPSPSELPTTLPTTVPTTTAPPEPTPSPIPTPSPSTTAPPPTATPTPSPIPTPPSTTAPPPTVTATPTPSPTVTATPTPSPTATTEPTVTTAPTTEPTVTLSVSESTATAPTTEPP